MKFLDKSLIIAKKLFPLNTERHFHVAMIFDRNKLISIGQNNTKKISSNAIYFGKRYNVTRFVDWPYEHSEINAIARIWSRIRIDSRLKIVVVRIGRSGKLLNSKPCDSCKTVMDAIGLDRVFFSTNDGFSTY